MDNFDIGKWIDDKLKNELTERKIKQDNDMKTLNESLDTILKFIKSFDTYCDDDKKRIKKKILEVERFFKLMDKENNEYIERLHGMFNEIADNIRDINNSTILEKVSKIDESVNEFKNEISCNDGYKDEKIMIKKEILDDRFEYEHKGLIKINKFGNKLEFVPLCLLFKDNCYYIDTNLLKYYLMEMEENKNTENIKLVDVYNIKSRTMEKLK